jgi:ferredoxin
LIAFYGFKDGSGDWFLSVDTDECNGCGKCVEVCPPHVLEVAEDEFDPLGDASAARVKEAERNKVRYSCAPCRPGYGDNPPPCVSVCGPGAIAHSEGWRLLYGK